MLENAFRYSSVGKAIGIFILKDSICVWDEGISIDINERHKIFEKGFRGKNTIENSGSGFGLALGKQLAEDIGCNLELVVPPSLIDDNLPQTGNAFVLSFPKEILQG